LLIFHIIEIIIISTEAILQLKQGMPFGGFQICLAF